MNLRDLIIDNICNSWRDDGDFIRHILGDKDYYELNWFEKRQRISRMMDTNINLYFDYLSGLSDQTLLETYNDIQELRVRERYEQ